MPLFLAGIALGFHATFEVSFLINWSLYFLDSTAKKPYSFAMMAA
jgi:hypothetical protein